MTVYDCDNAVITVERIIFRKISGEAKNSVASHTHTLLNIFNMLVRDPTHDLPTDDPPEM